LTLPHAGLYKPAIMQPRHLSMLLSLLTFILLLVGGIVHTTGASLACPDWPLCYGQVFPPMQGGILYEHSHRLLASAVGFITLCLAWLVWRQPDRTLRPFVLVGVALVVVQGLLGGLTVLLRLPALVSILHLGTSMAYFAWTIFMNFRLRGPSRALSDAPHVFDRRFVALAAGLVYLQLILGAVVRHTHASMSCGVDVLTCAGQILPQNGMQIVQTMHRVMAVVVLGVLIAATIRPMKWAKEHGRGWVRGLGIGIHIGILLQMLMGILTIKTMVHLHVVTTHLALGAFLWGATVALYVGLGPLGTPRRPTSEADERPEAVTPDEVRGLHGAC
jgi:heme A synthase